jgi:hypothetical protein
MRSYREIQIAKKTAENQRVDSSPIVCYIVFRSSRRGAGVAELARLESVCAGNRTEGSNPSFSASVIPPIVHEREFPSESLIGNRCIDPS